MKTIPSALKNFRRITWKPQIAKGDGTLDDSKFSGTPYLAEHETWPVCQNCGEPMSLFLQLNLNSLPEPLNDEFGSGLLQLFYCTNDERGCEFECETYSPFSQAKLVRIIEPDGTAQSPEMPEAALKFPPKLIIGWEEHDDYPNWEEGREQGISLTDDDWERLDQQGFPQAGDKLGGWPYWVQGIEYPDCPICHQRMRFVFQIDSNAHLAFEFGDSGCGHITQCPTHPDQVAFAWACA